MLKVYEQRDFGGGLNTSTAAPLLPPNQSPAMVNVDVTDTDAITTRAGYSYVNSTPMLVGHPLRDIYRFYKADGTKYWMGISATRLYAAQDVAGAVPLTRMELSTTNVTATSGVVSAISGTGYSAGAALSIDVAGSVVSATVPYSNYLKVYAGTLTGSVRIDSGTWTALAASSTYTPAGLSATTHIVSFKTKATNTSALRITPGAANSAPKTMTCATSIFDYPASFSVRFYDPNDSGAHLSFGVRVSTSQGEMKIGLDRTVSTTHYSVDTTVTSVARSTGWHTISGYITKPLGFARISIDGVSTGVAVSRPLSFFYLALFAGRNATGSTYVDFDRLIADGVLKDDFANTTYWSPSGSGSASIQTSRYDSTPYPSTPDAIDYACFSGWLPRGPALSATANLTGFATLNNVVYYGTAYNDVRTFTGATTAAVSASGTTKAAFLTQLKRRLFAGGIASDKALMNYTAIDNGAGWSIGDSARLAGLDSGGDCTGMVVFDNKLFWFGESRLYALDTTGTDDTWTAYTLSEHDGCIAPRSLAVSPIGMVWLSGDGVRAYGPVPNVFTEDGADTTLMSREIAPTLAAFTDTQKKAACGASYKGRYWLAIGGHVYVCHLTKRTKSRQPVWAHHEYASEDISCLYVTRGDEYGLFAGTTTGRLIRLDDGHTDGGASIDWSFRTVPFAPAGAQSVKHFRTSHFAIDSPTMQAISMTPTTGDINGVTQSIVPTAESDTQPIRVETPCRGRAIDYTLASEAANQPVTISSIAFTYTRPSMR